MFKTRRTEIVSIPVEEILEVKEPIVETPKVQSVSNIEFLTVDATANEISSGKLIDYDKNIYRYDWDHKSKRIMRLTGTEVNKLTWDLANRVLEKYFIKPEPVKPVESVSSQIERNLRPVQEMVRGVEGKLDKLLLRPVTPTVSTPRPAPSYPAPTTVQSSQSAVNMDTPAISVGDDQIAANAMKFLQESQGQDLGIDYLSL